MDEFLEALILRFNRGNVTRRALGKLIQERYRDSAAAVSVTDACREVITEMEAACEDFSHEWQQATWQDEVKNQGPPK